MKRPLLMASVGLAGVVAAATAMLCVSTGCSTLDYYMASFGSHSAASA